MTFFCICGTFSSNRLVRGDMENVLDCFVVGNISANSWRLHAPALLLLVLPRKSNMFPDLSASGDVNSKDKATLIRHTVRESWMTAGLISCEHICMRMMIGVCDLRGFLQHLPVATVSATSQQDVHCVVGSVQSTMSRVQCSV